MGRLTTNAIEYLSAGGKTLVTSELSLTECLFGPRKSGKDELAGLYVRLLTEWEIVQLVPAVQPILIGAAEAGAAAGLKIIDAIHFATALATGCGAFLTNDLRLRPLYGLADIQLSEL